ncbi:MAG: nucleoside deaminase [Flavobacteriales bacterium]
MEDIFTDEYFMRMAFKEAEKAFEENEVPVGAVVVINNKIIAKGYNLTEKLTDVTAHAEMQCITSAANYLGGKYLKDCTLYVTLEPCSMCAGALYWAQLGKLVYGTSDEKRGFVVKQTELHPKTEIISGVMEQECKQLIRSFFDKKRTRF